MKGSILKQFFNLNPFMMKHTMRLFTMLGVILLLAGCGGPEREGALYIPANGWELKFADSEPGTPAPVTCTGERPERQGCNVPCKPCFFFICEDGEWKRKSLTWPPGMCGNRGAGPSSGVKICPLVDGRWCPPGCDYCF